MSRLQTHKFEEIQEQTKPYFNFINSLKSDFTKRSYWYAMMLFLKHYNITADKLAVIKGKDIETLLLEYIVLLNIVTAAATHFCVMNDINLMTKKISKH